MKQQMKDLLQLYENTIASQGYMRREAATGVARSQDDRMGHARWMIDQMQQNADRDSWSETRLMREVGIIQGILWSENQFSMRAIENQCHALDGTPGTRPILTEAPAPAPIDAPSIVTSSDLDGDAADVAFAAEMNGPTPVAVQPAPGSGAIPVTLPE
jgi:hypothetical protein